MTDSETKCFKRFFSGVSWKTLPGFGILWMALLVLYTRSADFPFWYHWDEESKAHQIISGTRNLNHPQLLLNSAAALERIIHPDSGDIQHVTLLGRMVSAGFAAAGVGILVLCAVKLYRTAGGMLTLLFLGLHPRLFELAHFFKEDTALFFGWASVMGAAIAICWSSNSRHGG